MMDFLPEWVPSLAFVAFLFAMFYWMVARVDKLGAAVHAVLTKLADEFHAHQLQDARDFGEIKATIVKPQRKRKGKAK